MAFTKRKTPDGNVEVFQDGQRIATGTSGFVAQKYPTATEAGGTKIAPIQPTAPSISSEDNATKFKTDKAKIDDIDARLADISAEPKKEEPAKVPAATGEAPAGKPETTGDAALDKVNAFVASEKTRLDAEAEERKAQYKTLFTTSLAALEATTAATITGIQDLYAKRIEEQKRLNQLRVDKLKAYAPAGRFTPIAFSDAITVREEEAADAINELEGRRNSLIAEAKAARDKGGSRLLGEKLENLESVNEEIRTRLSDIQKESIEQYKLVREVRKEEETRAKTAQTEAVDKLRKVISAFVKEYEEAEDKDKVIQKIVNQTQIDYATVFGLMQEALGAATKAGRETAEETRKVAEEKRKEAEAGRKEKESAALVKQREASLSKTAAEIEKIKAQTSDIKAGDSGFDEAVDSWVEIINNGDATIANVPEKLKNAVAKKLAGGEVSGSVKERAEAAGFDYEAAKKAGYTDEEIDEFLK